MGTICLAMASFLNPFGFDILVYKITLLTKDYWHTMYILYVFAALFFGLSFISFKIGKKKLGNWLISLALFLNPLGYDCIVYFINTFTNNYWMTMSFMYVLTGFFFSLFLYLYKINPIKIIQKRLKYKNG